MAPTKFTTPLEASSYLQPGGGEAYAPLRRKVMETATAMGYDPVTMVECGIKWAEDQDPFGHVGNSIYPHYMALSNLRVFESFAEYLGDNRFMDPMKERGIGPLVKTYTLDLKRPTSYPDSLIVATRLTEVLPDRYHGITSIWSLRQQAIVAYLRGYVVFFDYGRNKPANLLEAGGVYADLHAGLTKRAKKANEVAAKWEKEKEDVKPLREKL